MDLKTKNKIIFCSFYIHNLLYVNIYVYRCAGKSLARPGRKQVNISLRMAWISIGALPCKKKNNLDHNTRLDVDEIARVPEILPSLFPSWSG